MNGRKGLLAFAICFVVAVSAIWSVNHADSNNRETLVITMPASGLIRNIDMNYYTHWLEEKTNTNLIFNLIPETYGADYLEQVFASSNLKTDIVFAYPSQEDNFFTYERVEALGASGYILPLDSFITETTEFQKIIDQFSDYDLRAYMTSADGNLYFFPNLDPSARARWGQSFWINRSWLQELKLPQPQTTEELRHVLSMFQSGDPNRNGLPDELPLAGNEIFDNIINSFVYNEPANMRMFLTDSQVHFAPMTDEWRQAMQYLNNLYQIGVFSEFQTSLSKQQITELASSPDNLLGGFTGTNIAEVIHSSCTDVINNFVPLAPVKGPGGFAFSTVSTPVPQVGALISADSTNPEKAFELLDLMLSEEAFLIARYGEEGVDWVWASASDLDSYGEKAVIKVQNQLLNKPQNKNFSGMGALYVYPEYADHVTWSGFDPEYLNARAYLSNLQYLPTETLGPIVFRGNEKDELNDLCEEVERYTEEYMISFITGEKAVSEDAVWEEYLNGYEQLGIKRLISETQSEYDALLSWRKERTQ